MNHAAIEESVDTSQAAPDRSSRPIAERSIWRRLAIGCCIFLAWCVALALAVAVLLRIFQFDATYWLTCFNAFTPYVYLPAYVCLAGALWQKRWCLATLSLALVVWHAALVLPDFRPALSPAIPLETAANDDPTANSGATTLRILYANIYSRNREYASFFDEVARYNPELIAIVEFNGIMQRAINESPVMKPYIHRGRRRGYAPQGIAILSQLPLTQVELHRKQPHRSMAVEVSLGDRTVRLLCIHSPRPNKQSWSRYVKFWEDMQLMISEQPDPLIVIGDFNSTQHSRVYHQLTGGRLRGVHPECGRGYATTWPNERFLLPPIRIDHALVSSEVECLEIAEGNGVGSDHRPLLVDLRISGEN